MQLCLQLYKLAIDLQAVHKHTVLHQECVLILQESTIGAAFLTKTMAEQNVKFEIW